LNNLLKYIRFLSFDVTLGATLLTLALSDFFGTELPHSIPICMAISIWLIYTLDHLIDAKKYHEISIERHLFHRRNFKLILINSVIIALFGIYIVLSLPAVTFLYGLGLIMLVIVYFTLIYFFENFHYKEVLVAIVYSLGVFLGPLSLNSGKIEVEFNVFFIQLLLLAMINLLLFSYYDFEKDKEDKNPSIAIKLGKPAVQRLLTFFFMVLVIIQTSSIIYFLGNFSHLIFQFLFMLMTVVLFALKKWKYHFAINDRYQFVGDGVFFIPTIWLLV
jgi:4-hydroxybenzoate polyprenyltransferase